MGFVYSNQFDQESDNPEYEQRIKEWQLGNVAKARDCFYCGEALTYPLYHWSGEYNLYLHEECTYEFVDKVQRDCDSIRRHRMHHLVRDDGSFVYPGEEE
jgi:hypothetical protein